MGKILSRIFPVVAALLFAAAMLSGCATSNTSTATDSTSNSSAAADSVSAITTNAAKSTQFDENTLIIASDLVVVADIESTKNAGDNGVAYEATVGIEEVLKGADAFPFDNVTVVASSATDIPNLALGGQYLLFLNKGLGDDVFTLVGNQQGIWEETAPNTFAATAPEQKGATTTTAALKSTILSAGMS